jgi:hypothetical protein
MYKLKLSEAKFQRIINETIDRILKENSETRISPRVVKKWEKFNNDLNAFYAYSGDECIYEDAYTPRHVKNFSLTLDGILTYEEYDVWRDKVSYEKEEMYDDDEALEWLKDFKKWLNKAKKYFNTDADTLDAIHDGQVDDIGE